METRVYLQSLRPKPGIRHQRFSRAQTRALQTNDWQACSLVLFIAKEAITPLDDPIPGAPAIPEDVPVLTALNRLEKAFVALRDHQDSFQPHFVFGSLTKEQYALVQVIHFYNHLDEVRAV